MKKFLLLIVFILNLIYILLQFLLHKAQLKNIYAIMFLSKSFVNYGDVVDNTITVDNPGFYLVITYGEIEILCMTENILF